MALWTELRRTLQGTSLADKSALQVTGLTVSESVQRQDYRKSSRKEKSTLQGGFLNQLYFEAIIVSVIEKMDLLRNNALSKITNHEWELISEEENEFRLVTKDFPVQFKALMLCTSSERAAVDREAEVCHGDLRLSYSMKAKCEVKDPHSSPKVL